MKRAVAGILIHEWDVVHIDLALIGLKITCWHHAIDTVLEVDSVISAQLLRIYCILPINICIGIHVLINTALVNHNLHSWLIFHARDAQL